MSLRRKDLVARDMSNEDIDFIISGHMETVNALQEQITILDGKAKLAEKLQKDLDDARKELDEAQKDDYKTKYESLLEEHEAFKKEVENAKVRSAKIEAFKEIVSEIGITGEEKVAKVIKDADIDSMELDENGKLKDAKNIAKKTASEWAFIIPEKVKVGAEVSTPPSNNGGNTFESMSLSEKMAYANENPNSPEVQDWLKK